MKTREEVEELKVRWACSPAVWDLLKAPGFEEYKEELEAFKQEKLEDMKHSIECNARDLVIDTGIPLDIALEVEIADTMAHNHQSYAQSLLQEAFEELGMSKEKAFGLADKFTFHTMQAVKKEIASQIKLDRAKQQIKQQRRN